MENKSWNCILHKIERADSLETLFDLWREAHMVEEDYKETTVDRMERESFVGVH